MLHYNTIFKFYIIIELQLLKVNIPENVFYLLRLFFNFLIHMYTYKYINKKSYILFLSLFLS